jgi:RNA polymerase sigma factor (TIGR02999 family)
MSSLLLSFTGLSSTAGAARTDHGGRGKTIGQCEMSVIPLRAEADLSKNMGDVTLLLTAVDQGDSQGEEKLLEVVYEELRRLAVSKMARETPGHTLQPTALVHEAWLRLVGNKHSKFENRAHFFSAAAEAMRRILIDRARQKLTRRHGGGYERVDLEGQDLAAPDAEQQLLAVNEALDNFARQFPAQAEVVKLRYFAGMTNEETAQVLDISVSTVKNYWTFARTWIFHEITNSQ